jgi:hypothetical protein
VFDNAFICSPSSRYFFSLHKQGKEEIKLSPDWNIDLFTFLVDKMYHRTNESWDSHEDLDDFIAKVEFAHLLESPIWSKALYSVSFDMERRNMAKQLYNFFKQIDADKEIKEIPWNTMTYFERLKSFLTLGKLDYVPKHLFYSKLLYTIMGVQRGVMQFYEENRLVRIKRERLFSQFLHDLPPDFRTDLALCFGKSPPLELFRHAYNNDGDEIVATVEKWNGKTHRYEECDIECKEITESDLETCQIGWYPSYIFAHENVTAQAAMIKERISGKSFLKLYSLFLPLDGIQKAKDKKDQDNEEEFDRFHQQTEEDATPPRAAEKKEHSKSEDEELGASKKRSRSRSLSRRSYVTRSRSSERQRKERRKRQD